MHPSVLSVSFAALLLLVPQALAAPFAAMALTPGGYRFSASIHEVPLDGHIAHVGSHIHVINATGQVVQVTSSAPRVPTPVPEEASGWISYASWLNSDPSPISSFTASWIVPPVPTAQHGQTIFLFNSIEPATGDAILQPVLQYGPSAAGGGDFWAVATWYLFGDQTFFTQPVAVQVGQPLTGNISLAGTHRATYSYTVSFAHIHSTALTIHGSAPLSWATETLEAYGINVALAGGVVPAVAWGNTDDVADGLTTTVDVDGATDAQITITY
ncbi:hypothetical protein FB451DRAFT_1406383 [Mycena latifolia]|nr:hypothetical protein FB451DRAFT_1406383 [Mycena latifolia]